MRLFLALAILIVFEHYGIITPSPGPRNIWGFLLALWIFALISLADWNDAFPPRRK